MRRVALICAALSLVSPPFVGDVRANDLADEAELNFSLGAHHYQRGEYRDALAHFLASNRLVPNRNVLFNIARCYEKLAQFPEAYRYYSLAFDAETDAGARERIEAARKALVKNIGLLEIASEPPGATVYLDRRDLGPRGSTPRALGVEPGSYTVILERAGYYPVEVKVSDLAAGDTERVSVKLKPILGQVAVGESVRGAFVKVDDPEGPVACVAPCRLDLRPGAHTLYFERPGFVTLAVPIDVRGREEIAVAPRQEPLAGNLVVETDEPGALVQAGDRPLGFTPGLFRLPVGTHRLRVGAAGFRTVERTVTVSEQRDVRVDIELTQAEEVIGASRALEFVEEAPSSVTIVPRQELRLMRYPTIVEALRGVPGVYSWDDRSYASLGFRGLGRLGSYGNRVLVLLDGYPLNDDWIGSSYVGYDARVTLDDLERIEVVRGPGSVLYGTNAFSGVVNLVPRPLAEQSGAEFSLGTSGDGVATARVRGDARFGKNFGVWSSASIARGQGRDFFYPEFVPITPPEVGGYARDADGFEAGTLEGRFTASWFAATWYFQVHDKRIPTGEYDTLLADPRAKQRDIRAALELKAEPRLTADLKSLTRVHLNQYRFRGGYPRAPEDAGLEVDRFDGAWIGAEQRLEWRPSQAVSLTAGVEGQLHFEVEQEASDAERALLNEEHPYELGAAYALADVRPRPGLRFSAGARLDTYSTFGESLNPRVAAIFEPYSGGNLKLMAGKAFRAPSVYELYYNDGGRTQRANPNLSPENIYSLEMEHTHRFSPIWSASAAIFGNQVRQLIVEAGGSASAPLYYENSDHPIGTYGVEVVLRRDFRQGYSFSASYSFQRSTFLESESLSDLFDASDAYRHVANSPEHLITLKGGVPVIGKALQLGSRLTVESGRWDRYEAADEPPQQQTSAFAIWDVVLSGEEPRFGFWWAVGVYNAFDWRYSLPVSGEFLQTTIQQSGRTLLVSGDLKF
jgi:outer membrane cobalamin receptor